MLPRFLGGGHFVFGVDPFGINVASSVGIDMTLSCLHNIVKQWLGSYQIFIDM